jgi:hypothetical protein
MAIEDAELETDLFYVDDAGCADDIVVRKRGLVEHTEGGELTGREAMGIDVVCAVDPQYPDYAQQIAHALNRLPKAERLLIEVAAKLRRAMETGPIGEVEAVAQEIEDFICG